MLTTQLANLKSKLEILTERNLTMQEAVDKKMALYQQKVPYNRHRGQGIYCV